MYLLFTTLEVTPHIRKFHDVPVRRICNAPTDGLIFLVKTQPDLTFAPLVRYERAVQ